MSRQSIFITGAAAGIGQAVARLFAREGWFVGLYDVDEAGVQALRRELGEAKTLAGRLDVTDPAAWEASLNEFVAAAGRLDVLLNNAGILFSGPVESIPLAQQHKMIDVNLKGVLYGIAAALPHMARQKGGHIINVSSVAGHKVRPGSAVYAATKTAVRVLSEGLRQEVKPYGIRTTIISPGAVESELVDSVTEADVAAGIRELYERTAIPAEAFARMVAFAIAQPEEVDVNEILFRPTAQEL